MLRARLTLLVVALCLLALPAGASATIKVHPPLPRDAAQLRAAKAAAARRYDAHAPARSAQTSTTPRAASVFNGLNHRGLGDPATNNQTPSDSTGAIGPNHYVEMVNAKIGVFSRSGLGALASRTLEAFIGHSGDFTFDPQVIWDPTANRWFYLLDDTGPTTPVTNPNGDNFLAFGWSKSADPTDLAGGWCHFRINTDTKFGGARGQYFPDYPKLGHNDTHLAFGSNLFDQNNAVAGNEEAGFLTGDVLTVPKPANGTISTCPAEDAFQGPISKARGTPASFLRTASGEVAFTPVPVNIFDRSGTGYVVTADSPGDGASRNTVSVHRFDSSGNVSSTATRFTVAPFDVPASAPQPGTVNRLDTLDARLTQAVGHADPRAGGAQAIWTQHTINGPGDRAAVRWYELLPSSGQIRQQGTVSDSSSFAFNGAISPASDGSHAALDYNLSGPNRLPSIFARSRSGPQDAGFLGPATTVGVSEAPMNDRTSCSLLPGSAEIQCRWGDYAAATPDPANALLVWGSNQLSGTLNVNPFIPQWITRNFALNTRDAAPTARFRFSPSRTLTKTAVSFDGRSSTDSDGRVASYAWNFGGRQTSTSAHPRHVYGRDGHYRVKLTITDDGGNRATTSHIVTIVNRAPLVSLRVLTRRPRARHTVRFDARRSRDPDGRVTAYHWNFGDHRGSSRSAPAHVYRRAGRYRVTLTVVDDERRSTTVRRRVVVVR